MQHFAEMAINFVVIRDLTEVAFLCETFQGAIAYACLFFYVAD